MKTRSSASAVLSVLAIFVIVMAAASAEARKFEFKDVTIAPYFGGTFGTTLASNTAFSDSDGKGTSTDQSEPWNASGEFGFVFSGKSFNLKLGAEYLLPKSLTGINGTNASGTQLFTLNSSVYAVVPMATIEFLIHQGPESKFVFGLGGGEAFLTLENDYTMTAAGTTALGVGNMSEKGTGQAMAGQAYLGYEFLFTDNVTLVFDAGYRYIPITTVNSTQTVTAPVGGETAGQPLLNQDGGNRTVNLSGFFGGLALRFYL